MSIFHQTSIPGPFHNPGFYTKGHNFIPFGFTSEASGAVPSAFAGSNMAVATIVRDSTGSYTATMNDQWSFFVGSEGGVLQTAGTYDAAKAFDVKVFAVDLANRTVKFATTRPDTGVVIDMAAGDILWVKLEMGFFSPETH